MCIRDSFQAALRRPVVYVALWIETATRQPLLGARTMQAQRAGALADAHQGHARTQLTGLTPGWV
eukprot:8095783-Alexandrium_andersonii.AAC.1